jgi:integrase
MGSVYKRRNRKGVKRRNYTLAWKDASGVPQTKSSGTSDKRAAERMLAEEERKVALIVSGVVDPHQERYVQEASKPIRHHLDDYLVACRGRQAVHALNQKERHLDWLLDATGAAKLTDILPDVLDARLSALAEEGKAARTLNLKLECANAFLNWCVRNGRLNRNPLKVVQRRNEVTDQRHPRRALTEKETRSLIAVAREQARTVHRAETRPLWYLLPLLAGLRRSDMERLTWGDLDLDQGVLTVCGGKAKHRVDRLRLHKDLVGELVRVKPSNVLPSAYVFPRTVANKTRQDDFVRAGIPLVDDRAEHADLHSLRVTYGTRLALAGVAPAILQKLMRHSTIELTMRYYTKLSLDDLGLRGVDLLPSVEGNEPEAKDGDVAEAAS